MHSRVSTVFSFEAKVLKSSQVCGRFKIHISTISTVTTIGTPTWDKLLSSKAHAAWTPMAGTDFDLCFIYKTHAVRYSVFNRILPEVLDGDRELKTM
jgi:hypothetical protein